MENMILEPVEEKKELTQDEEKLYSIFDNYAKVLWDLYEQNSGSDELREKLEKEPLELTGCMLEFAKDEIECEDDARDVEIVVNELTIAMVQILHKISDKTRKDYLETFVNKD